MKVLELLKTIALAIGGLLLAVLTTVLLTTEPASAPSDTTPAQLSETGTLPESVEEPKVGTTTETVEETLTEPKPVVKPKSPTPKTPAPVTEVIQVITAPIPEEPPAIAPSTLNEKVRAAVVNIVCVTESGGVFNSISASGVVIEERGVILTNAHVAQYFLLRDYPTKGFVDCYIRTGSPATPAYTAELLFIPPSWIAKNAQKIDDTAPTGNGEHDYALLRITGTLNESTTLPNSFFSLPIATAEPKQGETTLLAGYPAGFLGGITVAKELYQASSLVAVRELYTFGTNTADLFSIGGSVVAQKGSSGGAVANDSGELLGLIVTSTAAEDTASRDLRAIATTYLIRDFEKESGTPLFAYLAGDVALRAQQFALGIAPTLTQTLINALQNP